MIITFIYKTSFGMYRFFKKKICKGKAKKGILSTHHNLRHMGFWLGDFIEVCKYIEILKEKLLDLFIDIAYGIDRKKGTYKVCYKTKNWWFIFYTWKRILKKNCNVKRTNLQTIYIVFKDWKRILKFCLNQKIRKYICVFFM